MRRSDTTSRTRQFALFAAILSVLTGGCVERRVVIRSNPPGALVYVDDHEVGITPVAISPIYYGNRKIRLVKDGCETKTVIEPMPPPWYEIPPLDFFSENVVPGTLHDSRTLDFQLDQQGVVPKEELLARAENLRRGTQTVMGAATPGFRVNPPAQAPVYVPPAGTPGGPPIGGQPYYQLPPGAAAPAMPGSVTTPPSGFAPAGPPVGGPIYQGPPTLPPSGPVGPATSPGVGSQPYFPLPSGG
jgi:hypothetical protein